MSSTYKVHGMTTIQVDIFDAVRYLSTANCSTEEGGRLPSRMAHYRAQKLGRYSGGVLREIGCGTTKGKVWCLLIYGEPG